MPALRGRRAQRHCRLRVDLNAFSQVIKRLSQPLTDGRQGPRNLDLECLLGCKLQSCKMAECSVTNEDQNSTYADPEST